MMTVIRGFAWLSLLSLALFIGTCTAIPASPLLPDGVVVQVLPTLTRLTFADRVRQAALNTYVEGW